MRDKVKATAECIIEQVKNLKQCTIDDDEKAELCELLLHYIGSIFGEEKKKEEEPEESTGGG